MFKMIHTLRFRLYAYFVILVALFAFTFAWITIHSESTMLTQHAVKRAMDISHATSKLIANDVLVDDYASACDALKAIVKDPDVRKIVLLDRGMSVLGVRSVHDTVVEDYSRTRYDISRSFVNDEEHQQLISLSNIDQSGDKKLLLVLSTQSVDDFKKRIIINTLYFVAPFLVAALMIVVFAFRPIVREIDTLSRFALNLPLSKGEASPTVSASLEIQELSNALTNASQTIFKQSTLLREHNEKLEHQVAMQTEKAVIQERLYMQQSRLAAMGEMISSIAHQWRQPLNGIAIMVQDLELSRGFNEINDDYLEQFGTKVMIQVKYLSETIDDFRNFFKIDKEKVSFDVLSKVEEARDLILPQLETHEIMIECGGDEEVIVTGYPNEFKQVVLNLITNAKDVVCERNIVQGKITLSVTRQEGDVIIKCHDNAGGILIDDIDQIFDPYFTTKGPERGTGIGLYMSKTIIENHMNGHLIAYNDEHGATLEIKLPYLISEKL